jgi:putative transposase
MEHEDHVRIPDRWARLRFAIIGHLLASPPARRGDLRRALRALAAQTWRHPVTEAPVQFAFATIEEWFYRARGAQTDPVSVLRRQVRADRGTQPAINRRIAEVLAVQYRAHPGWSYQLHADNLGTCVRQDATLGPMPSYATVRRYLKAHGLTRRRVIRDAACPGAVRAQQAREHREVRSYEATHVHALWHLDFHVGTRKVLRPDGQWVVPRLLGVIDDHSRLICHAQWYGTVETTAALVHGLAQAILKRGLPRALLTDNGGPMTAAETVEGLAALGIVGDTTRAYSPEQNAKIEHFWTQVEGRLMAMLEGHPQPTLALLNEATLAWIEGEYHQRVHGETGATPFDRFLHAPSVGRPSPSSEALRRAFRMQVERRQRRSDGTFSLDGTRFEVPSRYGHLPVLTLRYARWDLSTVDLYDARHGTHLCAVRPLDKAANADRQRRVREALAPPGDATVPASVSAPQDVAPLLRELMARYAATGLPPAYLPRNSPPVTPESTDTPGTTAAVAPLAEEPR